MKKMMFILLMGILIIFSCGIAQQEENEDIYSDDLALTIYNNLIMFNMPFSTESDACNCQTLEQFAVAYGGVISYRGSDEITIGNNVFNCWVKNKQLMFHHFVQNDNAFPIAWADDIQIGMEVDVLLDCLIKYGVTSRTSEDDPIYGTYSLSDDMIQYHGFSSINDDRLEFTLLFDIQDGSHVNRIEYLAEEICD